MAENQLRALYAAVEPHLPHYDFVCLALDVAIMEADDFVLENQEQWIGAILERNRAKLWCRKIGVRAE